MLSQGSSSNTLSASKEELYRIKKKKPALEDSHVRGVFILNCWIKLCNSVCNRAWSGCLSCQRCHPHVSGLGLHQLLPPAWAEPELSLLLLGVAALPPELPRLPGAVLCSSYPLQQLLGCHSSPEPAHARDPDGPRWRNEPGGK